MDFSAFPTLTDHDREQLAAASDALLIIGPYGAVTCYWPVGYDSQIFSGRKPGRMDEFLAAAEIAGVIIVDARDCGYDAFIAHTINSPLPAIGHFAARKIAFEDPDALGWISAADYARSFASIGARVINADEAAWKSKRS